LLERFVVTASIIAILKFRGRHHGLIFEGLASFIICLIYPNYGYNNTILTYPLDAISDNIALTLYIHKIGQPFIYLYVSKVKPLVLPLLNVPLGLINKENITPLNDFQTRNNSFRIIRYGNHIDNLRDNALFFTILKMEGKCQI